MAHIRCTKVGGRYNYVVITTHTSSLRLMCMELQLPILVTGMFKRPLLLCVYNVDNVYCVRRYLVKVEPNPR